VMQRCILHGKKVDLFRNKAIINIFVEF
jgi:hypothetical protein